VGSIFRAIDELELAFLEYDTVQLIRLIDDIVTKSRTMGITGDAMKRLQKAATIIKAERRR
jgi:hypothetical protein